MFKYTPKSKIAKTIAHKSRITGYLGSEDARRILQELGINDYKAISDFRRNFLSTVFFSEEKKKTIMVGCTQFPVCMFDVTVV
jgi:hypothetical protein